MRKIIFAFSLCLFAAIFAARAETVTLTDGASLTGDVVHTDDNGLMLHTPADTYTNVAWGQLSQDSLKQLSQNAKIAPFVEPFIAPAAPAQSATADIQINPVSRMAHPAHPSILIGMFTSSVGLFVLFMIYLASLYAAYEISIVKARPPAQVIGVAAVLPVIGPIIFLWLPMQAEASAEELQPAEVVTAPGGAVQNPQEEVIVVEASWKSEQKEEKAPEPQIFPRGKFTFNKRFMETKFAGYAGGEPKGDALNFTMEVKTTKEQFTVEHIKQISATDVLFETVQRGQITVLLADIQEVKLNPKTA